MRQRVVRVCDAALAHPVAAAFVVALAARLMLAGLINLRTGGSLVPDDITYHDMAAAKAAGQTDDWDPRTHFLYDATTTFTGPVEVLYRIFGPIRLLGQGVAALWGATTAGAVTALALRVQPRSWALAAGLVVGLLPSQVLWSSLTLKDAAVWAVLAMLALAVSRWLDAVGRNVIAWAVVLCLLLLMLSRLRDHTFMVAMIALVLASWAGTATARSARIATALAVALVLPWLAGLGPAGVDFVQHTGSLEARRYNNAVGANSALTKTAPPATVAAPDPAPGKSTTPAARAADEGEAEAAADLRHLPRGLSAMLLEPSPFGDAGSTGLKLARAETLVWYPILLLAIAGLTPALRERRTYLFPLLAGSGVCVLYALTEGNLGTAYRHRGELVWVVALLAAAGAERLARREGTPPAYTGEGAAPEATGADTRRYA